MYNFKTPYAIVFMLGIFASFLVIVIGAITDKSLVALFALWSELFIGCLGTILNKFYMKKDW